MVCYGAKFTVKLWTASTKVMFMKKAQQKGFDETCKWIIQYNL